MVASRRFNQLASRGRRGAALLAVLAVLLGTQSILAPGAGAAGGYVPISGSGSTWSSNALEQWRKNVSANYGIQVNFSANGSTSGRNDFKAGLVDFAVSEIPYGLSDGGVLDPLPQRKFAYMPIVAGGTSFMYNLKIGGKRVTNLRLSGDTITKIFTQKITKWSDPAIKADNPGLTLPDRTIIPVVRSDGSGTTAQFTAYMASQYGGLWDDYCHRNGRNLTPCGFTSFYPSTNGMNAKAGSQGVAGFVAQDSSEGAITYVEYSYARNSGFPIAKVLNKANYYVEPKATSVAVALLNARVNPSDLTADLSQVYVNPDPRTYPLSSYSYMIIPKDLSPPFNNEKGRTLSDFAYYFLCEGQQQADSLGYSPLPINLVQAGVDRVGEIPNSTHKLSGNNLSSCHNPTVSPDGGNLVAKNAPQPDPCDLKGASTQCNTPTGGAKTTTPTSGGNNATAGGGGPAGGGGAGGGGGGGPGTTDTTNSANGGDPGAAGVGGDGTGQIDPNTGQLIDGTTLGGSSSSGASAIPVSVDVADNRRQMVLAMLAAVLLIGLILGPPLVARTMRSRVGPQEGPLP
ncbi:MAG: phosphate ABC transporter substrate-binding protein PstS [Pseudonocardiales bacterium]|nr:phosphate ABC transporter substrate-binding protein PstS [Pseudonocardiales bacterium]